MWLLWQASEAVLPEWYLNFTMLCKCAQDGCAVLQCGQCDFNNFDCDGCRTAPYLAATAGDALVLELAVWIADWLTPVMLFWIVF